ncbi:MAG: IPExxxVDY family protein [Bacteroidetes bacterium]|nr:MAG: IPExxxVDY family protein [Bacteroidota bacterium]REK04671.1 MAG: IPExxxVDY family protein [Bacteroidota bacterium]REK36146.1 MAG: IPExxxVDY family protein [Bacteroidota bacterium]REK51483.1 MAG: IPExxxVDY family protein [Bacteroidota bacterium]
MAKTVLRLDDSDKFDFILIGIVCFHNDYRICREINISLDIKMVRMNDFDVFNNKRMETQGFAFFQYLSKEFDEFCLVANKNPKGILIPEQKQMDYFLMIRQGQHQYDSDELVHQLKNTNTVLGAYKLDVTQLKSKENLVF